MTPNLLCILSCEDATLELQLRELVSGKQLRHEQGIVFLMPVAFSPGVSRDM